MTAPHPGLTDLIAAEVGTHVVETVTAIDQLPWSERQGRDGYLLDCRCGAEVNCPQAEFNAAPVDSTSGALAYMIREHVAAHVALVVEQHTNGRTAELEAERDEAIAHDRQPYPTAWAYERACAALEKHRKRADEAEAELEKYRAEERRQLEWARHLARDDVRCPSCNLRYGERDQYGCIEPARAHDYDAEELRAALEGES